MAKVRDYIKAQNLKQTHIAEEIGINKSLLSIWLRGKVSEKQNETVTKKMEPWLRARQTNTKYVPPPPSPPQPPSGKKKKKKKKKKRKPASSPAAGGSASATVAPASSINHLPASASLARGHGQPPHLMGRSGPSGIGSHTAAAAAAARARYASGGALGPSLTRGHGGQPGRIPPPNYMDIGGSGPLFDGGLGLGGLDFDALPDLDPNTFLGGDLAPPPPRAMAARAMPPPPPGGHRPGAGAGAGVGAGAGTGVGLPMGPPHMHPHGHMMPRPHLGMAASSAGAAAGGVGGGHGKGERTEGGGAVAGSKAPPKKKKKKKRYDVTPPQQLASDSVCFWVCDSLAAGWFPSVFVTTSSSEDVLGSTFRIDSCRQHLVRRHVVSAAATSIRCSSLTFAVDAAQWTNLWCLAPRSTSPRNESTSTQQRHSWLATTNPNACLTPVYCLFDQTDRSRPLQLSLVTSDSGCCGKEHKHTHTHTTMVCCSTVTSPVPGPLLPPAQRLACLQWRRVAHSYSSALEA